MMPAGVLFGMTRDEVVSAIGEPDAKGASSQKYPTPACYLYGHIELHFEPWKAGRFVFWMDARTHHGERMPHAV